MTAHPRDIAVELTTRNNKKRNLAHMVLYIYVRDTVHCISYNFIGLGLSTKGQQYDIYSITTLVQLDQGKGVFTQTY